MPDIQSQDSLSRWLTIERIGLSQFMAFVYFENRSFWDSRDLDDLPEWTIRILKLFACGQCYSLAAAVGLETDLPILVIRRRVDRGLERIAHAAVYDPTKGLIYDILGCRPAATLIEEMREAVGQLSLEVLHPGTFEAEDHHEIFASIGAGLPWMPRGEGRAAITFEALYEAVGGVQVDIDGHRLPAYGYTR